VFEDAVLLKNQDTGIEDLRLPTRVPQTGRTPLGFHVAWKLRLGDHICIRSRNDPDINGVDQRKPRRKDGGINYTSVGEQEPSRFGVFCASRIMNLHVGPQADFSGWADSWVRSKCFPSLGVVVRGTASRHWGRWDRVLAYNGSCRTQRCRHAISGRMESCGYLGLERRQFCDSLQRGLRNKRTADGEESIPTGQPEYCHPIQYIHDNAAIPADLQLKAAHAPRGRRERCTMVRYNISQMTSRGASILALAGPS